MALLEFINSNKNWREILQNEPYNLNITSDSFHTIIKYKKLQFDFSNPIVKEARGCIVYNTGYGYKYCCRPFDKFGNYGEDYADTDKVNWSECSVREKVDGSLIKIWYSPICDCWVMSTNGTINAKEAFLPGTDISYYNYFVSAIGLSNFPILLKSLDENYTYMFELVGPENKIIVDYEKGVYFLAARHNLLGDILNANCDIVDRVIKNDFIKTPKVFNLKNLNECIDAAAALGKNKEGFVVSDANGNMVKVKSPEYLLAARINNNGILTTKRAIEIIKDNKVDDFYAYASEEHTKKMKKIVNTIDMLGSLLDSHGKYDGLSFDRKDIHFYFVNLANMLLLTNNMKKIFISFGMSYYDGKVNNGKEYLMNKVLTSKLEKVIEEYLM